MNGRPSGRPSGRWAIAGLPSLSELALGGGVFSAALLLSALWLLARPPAGEGRAEIRALHDLAHAAGGLAHVIPFAPFFGAASI